MREIRTVSHLNLGDNIYNVFLFRKLIDFHGRDLKFKHYIWSRYVPEISNFIEGYEDNIIFEDILEYTKREIMGGKDGGWFINYDDFVNYHKERKDLAIMIYGVSENWEKLNPGTSFYSSDWDRYLLNGFKNNSEYYFDLECPIKTVEDTYLDLEELLIPNKLSGDWDLLLANNKPMSGQWEYGNEVFDYLLSRIDLDKIKVISLEPTGDPRIPSTIEAGLNLLEVGNIAINSKVVIGIHSSPYCTIINKFNFNTNEFVVLQTRDGFTYGGSKNCQNFRTTEDFINNWKVPISWCKSN
jgi:hypothetical protein